ncbi:hypothetical protein [Lederbergia galactosidilytica]|uniref:hypothetical protein n=1 Tax=Lederbergia galactosidilytica TaxID=217031 RepID=UPI0013F4DBDF|nr:hypothetical protein [Lederbergia galactosidilytica]MBP1914325.1 hypothetical protein [Lederbergia galactosidilytica]
MNANLEMLTIEQLVSHDHLVRKLDAAIDFSFIYPLSDQPMHREYESPKDDSTSYQARLLGCS